MNRKNRLDLIHEFELASELTLFDQETPAALFDCSSAKMERSRWDGTGIPFVKIGRSVRYRKIDILNYLNNQKICQSTSQLKREGKNHVR